YLDNNVAHIGFTINGNNYVGGLIGYIAGNSTVLNITNNVIERNNNEVEFNIYSNNFYVGRLIGYADKVNKLDNNKVFSFTKIYGKAYVGGLIGKATRINSITYSEVRIGYYDINFEYSSWTCYGGIAAGVIN